MATKLVKGAKDNYSLSGSMGRDALGWTYQARRESDRKLVVLRRLPVASRGEVSVAQLIELCRGEGELLCALDHPCLPQYLDCFALGPDNAPQGFAYVREHIPGPTLDVMLRSDQRMSPEQHTGWLHQMLDICTYIHNHQPMIVHGNIRPENIVLHPTRGAVLLGLRRIEAVLSAGQTPLGFEDESRCKPPEQRFGHVIPPGDLYAIAISYLSVVAGCSPEELLFGDDHVDVDATLQSQAVHVELVKALKSMSHPDPKQRPGSAPQLLSALSSVFAASAAAEVPATAFLDNGPRRAPISDGK